MRPEPHNEIDLLLRQLSRRNGTPVSEVHEQHLDADELNSYVANALPAAARARYTDHLADCSICRKLVAQLSAAEGPVAVQQNASVVTPSRWKSFLASLFSPMVLRYAVPALGLMVVAVIGIVVLRRDQPAASVARLEDTDRNRPVLQTPATPEAFAEIKNEQPQGKSIAPVTKEPQAPVAKESGEAAGTAATPPPAAPKAAAVADEAPPPSGDLQKPKKAEQATQPAGAADAAKDRAEEPVKHGYQAPQTGTVTVAPGQVTRRDVEVRRAKTAENTAAGVATDAKRSAKADETDVVAETRSVAGRRFRKTDDGWTDTAYNSSQSMTNVARGSEQYRALVGDEPSLRTIAEELDGIDIFVWNGRAYRFR